MSTMRMQSLSLVLSITLCSICLSQATRYPDIYDLHMFCDSTIPVFGDVIVRISSKNYFRQLSCNVTLSSYLKIQMVASIRGYNMNRFYISSTNCPYESIQLGAQLDPALLGPSGYCKYERPTGQYFLQYQGTFSYRTISTFDSPPDVELLVTEMFPTNATGSCPPGYFNCLWRNTCIDYSLTCNGYDDCGNSRDEIYGCGFTFSVGAIGGLAAGVFFFIVFVVIISVVCYRRRYRVTYQQHS